MLSANRNRFNLILALFAFASMVVLGNTSDTGITSSGAPFIGTGTPSDASVYTISTIGTTKIPVYATPTNFAIDQSLQSATYTISTVIANSTVTGIFSKKHRHSKLLESIADIDL